MRTKKQIEKYTLKSLIIFKPLALFISQIIMKMSRNYPKTSLQLFGHLTLNVQFSNTCPYFLFNMLTLDEPEVRLG
jgi:hypothetical protein